MRAASGATRRSLRSYFDPYATSQFVSAYFFPIKRGACNYIIQAGDSQLSFRFLSPRAVINQQLRNMHPTRSVANIRRGM